MSETLIGNVRGLQGERGPQGAAGETGATGPQGPTGPAGQQGTPGVGVPTGGTTGQVLKKKSATDYDTEWGEGGGGAITVNDTPVVINVDDLVTTFNAIPDNTIGTVQFVETGGTPVKYRMYKDCNPWYDLDYSTMKAIVHKVAATFTTTGTNTYMKVGGHVWLNGIPAILSVSNVKSNSFTYALFENVSEGLMNRCIPLLSLGTSFMGLDSAAAIAGLEFANLVFSYDYGWELISGMNLTNYPSLPGFDCLPKLTAVSPTKSEDVLTFTSAMSNLKHWDTRSYIAEIVAYDGSSVEARDWAKVTISQFDDDGTQKLKVVCEPLNITGNTDLTAYSYYLNNPVRMKSTKQ